MTIGQRIKERRKELGMSADELGVRLGVNRSTVFRYENGFIEKIPIDILKPIAEALQTTPQYLMGWEEEQNKSKDKSGNLSLLKKQLIERISQMTDNDVEKLIKMLDIIENR